MKQIIMYLTNVTETFREKLAWKIFPEFGMYAESIKRIGEIEENERCLKVLQQTGSEHATWAQEEIAIKYTSYQEILDKLKEEGFEEPPF